MPKDKILQPSSEGFVFMYPLCFSLPLNFYLHILFQDLPGHLRQFISDALWRHDLNALSEPHELLVEVVAGDETVAEVGEELATLFACVHLTLTDVHGLGSEVVALHLVGSDDDSLSLISLVASLDAIGVAEVVIVCACIGGGVVLVGNSDVGHPL